MSILSLWVNKTVDLDPLWHPFCVNITLQYLVNGFDASVNCPESVGMECCILIPWLLTFCILWSVFSHLIMSAMLIFNIDKLKDEGI